MNKQEKNRDAMIRWQETQIKQFSYVNYLALTLALAILGFLIREYNVFSDYSNTNRLLQGLLVCFTLSIIAGLACAYSRLCDFRKTTEIARLKHQGKNNDSKICKLRLQAKRCGEISWFFLQAQIVMFILPTVLVGIWWFYNL